MSPGFSIGLLVTNDDIDAVILEGWPDGVPKPRMVVFDYAGNDVLDDTMRLLDETVYDTRELETKQATLGERIEETITLMNQLITPQPRPPTTLTTTTAVTTSLKIGTTNLRPSINGSATRSTICATAEHKQSKYATTLPPNHHSNTPTKPGTPSSITPPSTTTALSNSHSRTALPRLEPALNE